MSEAIKKVGIHGAKGRMGMRLIQLIADDPDLVLGAALDRAGHQDLGADAGTLAGVSRLGVALEASLPEGCQLDVMIDFSLPEGSLAAARLCAGRKIPLVVGTTGFDPAGRAALESLADRIPILIAPNMSRAVNLLMRLVRDAAGTLAQKPTLQSSSAITAPRWMLPAERLCDWPSSRAGPFRRDAGGPG